MQIHCPHCQNVVNIVDKPQSSLPESCPKCGSRWKDWSTDTATYTAEGQKRIGPFQLLSLLGMGHFGEVWSARDIRLDRKVAVKIPRRSELSDEEAERFLREARAAGQLKHPNIVAVHEVMKEDGLILIVSDLIEGVNLADRLQSGWRPTPAEAASICATLSQALQHAHDNGIIHRDLKPANVLVDNHEWLYLTDFGLAKREGGEITMTVAGQIFGTPAYMSPEQARGDGHNADARSDVYSLGIMLFEMLTGVRPFKGNSQLLINQILHKNPVPPRKLNAQVPRDLETICLKALEKDPSRRFQSASEMGDELRRFLSGNTIKSRPISILEKTIRWYRQNKTLATIQAVCCVLFALLGIVGADNYRRVKAERPVFQRVVIRTYPPGAKITCIPLSSTTGEPLQDQSVKPAGVTPAEVRLKYGEYLIVSRLPNYGSQEVFRIVPEVGHSATPSQFPHQRWTQEPDGKIALPMIWIRKDSDALKEMVRFEGGEVTMLASESTPRLAPAEFEELQKQFPPRQISPKVPVSAFWLDPTELTVAQARELYKRRCDLPDEVKRDWQLMDIDCEKPDLPDGLKTANTGGDNHPLVTATYDEALRFAELAGKRLMSEEEYLFAATNGSTTRYPWGDDPSLIAPWSVVAQEYDKTLSPIPVSGLYSGAAEWTLSWPIPLPTDPQFPMSNDVEMLLKTTRVVRGAPLSVLTQNAGPSDMTDGPAARYNHPRFLSGQLIGVRFAKSIPRN